MPTIEEQRLDVGFRSGTYDPRQYTFATKAPVFDYPVQNADYTAADIVGAIPQDTIPYRVGVTAAFAVDSLIRSQDPNDSLHRPDPTFNAFDVFKQNNHTESEFDDIIRMENWEQYARYNERRGFRDGVRDRIAAGGLTASAASLAANLVTDPTLYAGYGFSRMVSSGMTRGTAAAASGALSAANYEILEQFADENRTALDSAETIFFSAVFAGAMGRAVDTFYNLRGKNVLKHAKPGQSLDESVKAYKNDAKTLKGRSVGAAESFYDGAQDDLEIQGFLARNTARLISPFAPKLRFQLSSSKTIREFSSKMFGLGAKGRAQFAGTVAPKNAAELSGIMDDLTVSFGRRFNRSIQSIEKKLGVVHDGPAQDAAFLLANNPAVDLEDIAQIGNYREDIVVAAQNIRKHYQDLYDELLRVDVDSLEFRQGYGGPAMLNQQKIIQNFDEYVVKKRKHIDADIIKAKSSVSRIEKQIADLEAELAQGGVQALERSRLQRRITTLVDQKEYFRYLETATSEEVDDLVVEIAAQHRLGNFKKEVVRGGRKITPRFFNARNIDVEDMIDFLETDPIKLARSYSQDVRGVYGLQGAFGTTRIDDVFSEYDSAIRQEIAELTDPKEIAKLQSQSEDFKRSLDMGWKQFTGEFYSTQTGALDDFLNASADVTRMSLLAEQVLASLLEPMAIGIHHGMRGNRQFMRVLSKSIGSKELRALNEKTAERASAGLQLAYNRVFQNALGDDVSRHMITGNLSKHTSAASRLFQIGNGGVFWDDVIRTTHSVVQEGMMEERVARWVTGGDISADEIADLAFLGINRSDAEDIFAAYKKHGTEKSGVFFGNSDKWANRELAQTYDLALRRDLKRTALSPEMGDVPFWSKTSLGRLLFIFRGWPVTATQKYTISTLQRSDASIWMAATSMVGMASAIEILRRKASGTEDPNAFDPDEILWAGINRSGLLGALPDFGGNYVASRLFADTGVGRIYDYNDLSDLVVGPAGATANTAAKLATFPFEEINRVRTGKDPRGIESVFDEAVQIMPVPFIKDFLREQARELQED